MTTWTELIALCRATCKAARWQDKQIARAADDAYFAACWGEEDIETGVQLAASAFVLAIILASCGWPT